MLAPWKKNYDKPRQHIKKQRHYFIDKGPYSQSYFFFSLVTYRCENWTVKKAECQRIDAFQLWCWRRLLRVPWTARRSNQSILKEISPEYSFEGLMLKLKLQRFDHQIRRTDSLEKTPMLGKIEGRRRRGQQRRRWLDGITDSMDMSLSKEEDSEGQGSLACCSPWGHKESDMAEWLNNSNTLYPNSHCKTYLSSGFPLGPKKNVLFNKNDFHIFTVNNMIRSLSDHSDWQNGIFLRSNSVKILVSGNKSFIKSKLCPTRKTTNKLDGERFNGVK